MYKDHHYDEVNLSNLDSLAKKNSMAKQKQLDIMQNTIRKAGEFFSFVTESKIRAIAMRLQQNGIGSFATDAVIQKIIDNYEKFPSYKNIVELCRAHQVIDKVECSRCFGGGLVSLYEKESGRNYAFSCDCLNGSNFPKFASVSVTNLNLYTRYAPLKLGVKEPYKDLKERLAKYGNSMQRATKLNYDINKNEGGKND